MTSGTGLCGMFSPRTPTKGPRTGSAICVATGMLFLIGCDRGEVVGTAPPPKAVEVISLEEGVPRTETRIAGVVEPFRQSDVSFDVSGVIERVIDLGEVAQGPQYDGAGALLLDASGGIVREGDILAILDTTRFVQAVTAAELALASTDTEIEALQVEIEEVYPARIAGAEASAEAAASEVVSARENVSAAQAELELARTTVDRDRALIGSGAIAQSVLDESEATFRTATATLAQAKATLESTLQSERSSLASVSEARGDLRVRQANLESLRATRAEQVNDLDQAQTDLDSCVLRAPFGGRITGRSTERGSYINAGASVVELTMETVVKVLVTLSPEQERRTHLGAELPVYADGTAGGPERVAFTATVFEKSSVADSGTRTFRVGLILPNRILGDDGTDSGIGLTALSSMFPVLELPEYSNSELFINADCVYEIDGRPHVLALPDDYTDRISEGGVVVPVRVQIELTDSWQQIDAATLRGIRPNSRLAPGNPLVANPGEASERGIRIGSNQYVFRTGDVVRVGLDADLPGRGFWIPATSIIPRTGDNLVYAVEGGIAKEIVVDVLESSGSYRRVSSPSLKDGMPVVVRGMQYILDGDSVESQPHTGGDE
ncbi:MAG: HlyD family efflux transporter periplasmic adaptor subunit [Planctomycetota bacterium]